MADYYTADPARLEGQPKRTIAEYVEQHGVLVPRRFDTFTEAKASGIEILCRSEHPQDYANVSGLVGSPRLSTFPNVQTAEEFKVAHFEDMEKFAREEDYEFGFQIFCGMQGIDVDNFKREVSFSFWEHIPGVRQIVIADSASAEKYHIFSKGKMAKEHISNYTQWQSGRTTSRVFLPLNKRLPKQLQDNLSSLIATYEKVRNLPHFDGNHCPLMEFVAHEGRAYFVQYHRVRDFKAAGFSLDVCEAQCTADAVRGCTPPEGYTVDVTLAYAADSSIKIRKSTWTLPPFEEGSFDYHGNPVFSELMVRKRKVQIVYDLGANPLRFWGVCASAVEHLYVSQFFKPEVSLFLDGDKLISKAEKDALHTKAKETGQNQSIRLSVISDGRTAYVKRVA